MGDTPLRVACKEGRVAAAALLIEKGADINNRIKVMIYHILNKGVHYYWYHFYSLVDMHCIAPALRGN